ncbi:MAG: IS66 family insertion sequence element accessory protein TnpB [Erysipelotrichaceae bacterium]|nr:IS66 family insertion sequence element accessory protein TnpB [Erysipelotrichaceae bacterium]
MTNTIPEYKSRFDFTLFNNLYLIQKPVDLRKGIDGYRSIISSIHSLDPADGSLYLFTNKAKNKVKGIF